MRTGKSVYNKLLFSNYYPRHISVEHWSCGIKWKKALYMRMYLNILALRENSKIEFFNRVQLNTRKDLK